MTEARAVPRGAALERARAGGLVFVAGLDQPSEAAEVLDVVGDQTRNTVREHRRNDVGVMHLLAAEGNLLQEQIKLLRDDRLVFRDDEHPFVRLRRLQDLSRRKRPRERLRARHPRHQLAQYLTTDPRLDITMLDARQQPTRMEIVRRPIRHRTDQHIRIDEDALSGRHRRKAVRG